MKNKESIDLVDSNADIFFKIVVVLFVVAMIYLSLQIFVMKNDHDSKHFYIINEIKKEISAVTGISEREISYLATVSDPEILRGQPFFAKAKKGDKVLIYPQSKKAVLYNPSIKKVIEIAPINF